MGGHALVPKPGHGRLAIGGQGKSRLHRCQGAMGEGNANGDESGRHGESRWVYKPGLLQAEEGSSMLAWLVIVGNCNYKRWGKGEFGWMKPDECALTAGNHHRQGGQ